jgi:predicted  nucleic acid-binding Zn-ribbon protein
MPISTNIDNLRKYLSDAADTLAEKIAAKEAELQELVSLQSDFKELEDTIVQLEEDMERVITEVGELENEVRT